MPDKQQLTQQLLNQLPADDRPSFEWALKSWWQDLRDDGGLRLSVSGYDVFKFLSIKQYQFDFIKVLNEKEYTIILLTSRPYEQYTRIYSDTLQWLSNNKIKFDAINYASGIYFYQMLMKE